MSTQCDTFRRGVGKIILWRSHAAPFHRRFAAVYDPQAMVRLFPMYVMPVETLLDLEGGRLPKHEDINDKLVEYREGMAPCAFISQTWLSRSHPDDEHNSKLNLVIEIVRRAREGTLSIHPHVGALMTWGRKALSVSPRKIKEFGRCGFVWFDIFSVPQNNPEKQGLAIASISSYVADAGMFIVLAPGGVKHETGRPSDLSTWASRGWCRVESTSNALTCRPLPNTVLLATAPNRLESHGPAGMLLNGWFDEVVGLGAFTVPADAKALGPVINDLIEKRRAYGKSDTTESGMRWFRALTAMRSHLLQGTDFPIKRIESLDEWLAELEFFGDVNEGTKSGWSPLMYTVFAGRTDLVAQLLDRGADPKVKMAKSYTDITCSKATNLLMIAGYLHDDSELIQLLITRGGIDPFQRDIGLGNVPIHMHMAKGRKAVIDTYMAHDPKLGLVCQGMQKIPKGLKPAFFLFWSGQLDLAKHVLATYPELMPKDGSGTGGPQNFVAASCNIQGSLECTKWLLEEGFSQDDFEQVKMDGVFRAIFKIARFAHRLMRKPPSILDEIVCGQYTTALHGASLIGNMSAVELLLEHGADPASQKNPLGQTPLACAAMGGFAPICGILLRAGAPLLVKDKRGRTPLQWAKRRGHKQVVHLLEEWHPDGSKKISLFQSSRQALLAPVAVPPRIAAPAGPVVTGRTCNVRNLTRKVHASMSGRCSVACNPNRP